MPRPFSSGLWNEGDFSELPAVPKAAAKPAAKKAVPPKSAPARIEGNPDPKNFVIERAEMFGLHVVTEVVYPDCKNYEGRKILVFKGCTIAYLAKQEFLDPHFCHNSTHPSPFARFEPTEDGWYAARLCAKRL